MRRQQRLDYLPVDSEIERTNHQRELEHDANRVLQDQRDKEKYGQANDNLFSQLSMFRTVEVFPLEDLVRCKEQNQYRADAFDDDWADTREI